MNKHAFSTLRILVVDDDEFTLEFVGDQLRELGVREVLTAGNGIEALETLEQTGLFTPDLLICDLQMPGMDGIEFLRHLADRHYAGGICLFSGTHLSILEAAKQLAVSHDLDILGVLEKPVDETRLVEILTRIGASQPPLRLVEQAVDLSPDELREGIANGALKVFYQPKVSIFSRCMVGAECLARFQHPRHGLLRPAFFIPLAESLQLIDALTQEILRQASCQLAAWRAQGERWPLSINVSMLNLHALDVPEVFERIVCAAGVSPNDFFLEITESALPEKTVVALDILLRLRLKGFQLSLDDFGTGYSTMQSLSQIPFAELKLDQQFVRSACYDHKAMAILESSSKLAKTLNMQLVAEGVERQKEWAVVEDLGCDEVQGFFVAKPMLAEDLLVWKSSWDARPHKP